MRFFLAFGFLASVIQCGSLIPINVFPDLAWPDDYSLTSALTRVKKDADGVGYLEECSFVDSWQEPPGFINVLAFLDASWEYSHRQATMLQMLQGRLERSGITSIRFFVINSAEPEAAVNNIDVEDEKQAWGAAEPGEIPEFSEIERTREALKDKIGSDITFIQDTKILKIWEKLSASRDQVLVLDQCGRLSYRVIVPWSILHFPYVKAAILSTYKEQPCGGCNLETTTAAYDKESQTEELPEVLPENLNIKQMEEIAVKKYNLDETDNTIKKVYHGAADQDIPESVIKLLNTSAVVKEEKNSTDLKNSTSHRALMFTGYPNNDDSYINNYSQAPNATNDDNDDNKNENLVIIMDTLNINETTEAQNDGGSSSTMINESEDSVASQTVHSIEDQSLTKCSNGDEKSNYLENKPKIDASEFTESTNLKNSLQGYEENENADVDTYSMEGNESGSGYIQDDNSHSEVSNPSTSFTSQRTNNQIHRVAPTSGENNAEEYSENVDYVLPIRIIMRAPHMHDYGESTRKHEYLVLKLGDPEYHGHLEYDDFMSIDKEPGSESENKADETDAELELGSGDIVDDNDKKKHRHDSDRHGHKSGHRKSKGNHLNVVYDKDESPGFYGEDADYWRHSGNTDQEMWRIQQLEKNSDYTKGNEMQVEGHDAVNIVETNENRSTTVRLNASDAINEENATRYESMQTNIEHAEPHEEIIVGKELIVQQQVNKNNTKEEEIANRLLEHYSKLIPWLDYVID